jgi:CMP-N-acetylneuraminic acid synthetase
LKVLAVIVARSGSKRITDKNMKILSGKTLIDWAICAAKESKMITDIVISTDSDRYGEYAERKGIKHIKRPDELSQDDSDIAYAAKHALEESGDYNYVVTLQAAVPLRPTGAIDALLTEMIRTRARGGLSMVPRSPWIWFVKDNLSSTWWNRDKYPRTQTINWSHYEEVNAIQIARSEVVKNGDRWDFPLSIVELPPWCSVDIDTHEDLKAANEYVSAIIDILESPREYKTLTVAGN